MLEQVLAFEDAGVDLLLLQCSPQLEEMERFGRQVIAPYRALSRQQPSTAAPGLPGSLSEGVRGW